ncbi:maleylpyruvate isomerase family mycothiol-dependent enzyme [Nocardiopsis sp. NPDC050513]|uniref:maleylpyruvate isomerase family mycothiol-dependent enzyme n=1 Tax=Nocardiopsis sp. NPDC050513 TaxID=3364338 RepID=UPI0037A097C8
MSDRAPSPHDLTRLVSAAHALVLDLLDGLDDERMARPSALPGWTRGHVVQHLADNARAFDRQARCALRGELVDVYDGGQRGRDLSIERGASRASAPLREDLRGAQRDLEETWASLTPRDWRRPVRFRSATVLDTALARWREAEIHAVDLAVGYRPRDWSRAFALHVLDFLAARAPEGVRLVLRATDEDHTRSLGEGDPVEVSGPLRDLAAWMAGRDTDASLATTAAAPPDLGPWPPAQRD